MGVIVDTFIKIHNKNKIEVNAGRVETYTPERLKKQIAEYCKISPENVESRLEKGKFDQIKKWMQEYAGDQSLAVALESYYKIYGPEQKKDLLGQTIPTRYGEASFWDRFARVSEVIGATLIGAQALPAIVPAATTLASGAVKAISGITGAAASTIGAATGIASTILTAKSQKEAAEAAHKQAEANLLNAETLAKKQEAEAKAMQELLKENSKLVTNADEGLAMRTLPAISEQPATIPVKVVPEETKPNYLLYIGLAVLALFLLKRK